MTCQKQALSIMNIFNFNTNVHTADRMTITVNSA